VSAAELTFTGERFLPECRGEIWLEHWHRYHFAAKLARDRRVLDVASGEGYGSALLAATAADVVGVDSAHEAIDHSRAAYGHLGNLQFVRGDCTSLPFADGSFDLVVSFETIEHIAGQREFLDEVRRVLAADGMLLLSSPNKAEYTDRRGYANPFHVAELYRDELVRLLDPVFSHTLWYGQGIGFCSTISALGNTPDEAGELVGRSVRGDGTPNAGGGKEPLYFLVGCANSPAPLARWPQAFSVLDDPDDTVYRDYQDTYKKFVAASEAVATLRAREAEIEQDRTSVRESARRDIEFIQQRLAAAESRLEAAASEALELRAEAERARAEAEALKTLTARLGESAHAAQQSTLRLTAAMHEANARYGAELDRVQQSASELAAALAAERERSREELARTANATRELQRHADAQAAELALRRGWLWRAFMLVRRRNAA
jgi:SAM-dependent methyltransferase